MRISSVSRVWRSSTEQVDPIDLFEARSLRAVQAQEKILDKPFVQVLEQVQEEGYKRQIRIVEVLYAPGLKAPRRYTLR